MLWLFSLIDNRKNIINFFFKKTKPGQFYKIVDPGLVKVNLITEHIHKVDVKVFLYFGKLDVLITFWSHIWLIDSNHGNSTTIYYDKSKFFLFLFVLLLFYVIKLDYFFLIINKDNVYVEIFSVIYWHVVDPYRTMFGIADVRKALIERLVVILIPCFL
jgi:regulator of protease activity HflC (stomatin/prohibitin superfamily)